MSWQSDKTGRPKEEEGHERINISVNKFTKDALEKIKKDNGNISQFIERELNPVLKTLDPGSASIHIWRIQTYIKEEIISATEKNEFENAKALDSLAIALKDYMNLAGIPPDNLEKLADQSVTGNLKNKFLKDLDEVRIENVYGDPFKALSLISSLFNVAPPYLKEKLKLSFALARNTYDQETNFASKYFLVKTKIVPSLLDKFSCAIYES